MFKKKGRSLTYDQQCLVAIARALPDDDPYRHTIESEVKDNPSWTLEHFTRSDPTIPVVCGCGNSDLVGSSLTLDNLIEYGDRSGVARTHSEFCKLYASDKPRAVFIRTAKPSRVNIVVHPLNMFRTHWDGAVLHTFRLNGLPLFVERRTTFCKLFTRIGMWAWDREEYVLPLNWDEYDYDLRKVKPDAQYGAAVSVAGSWGYQRSRSKLFRDLPDTEFVDTVMKMQMRRMVESGGRR